MLRKADRYCDYCTSSEDFNNFKASILEQYKGSAQDFWEVNLINTKEYYVIFIVTSSSNGEIELEKAPKTK